MSRDPVSVQPDDSLAAALELTRRHRIRHLPVCGANGRVAGILSDRDIRYAMPSPLTVADWERTEFLERTPIAAVMTRKVITIGPDAPIEDAAKSFYKHRIGSLPVVDADERLQGILTETDILHAFVEILGGLEPSSRIEVGLDDQPGELARALQVVGEELAVNIVSIVVPSVRAQGRKTAILHVATIDPRTIIARLESGGYQAGWPSLAAEPAAPAAG
jgi:acetoin utilization protein AcuB